MKIKVCGITNLTDALMAAGMGADALGFIFYAKSQRAIRVEEAAKICRALPPFVSTVGVFVNAEADVIRQAVAACSLTAIQFHGDEPPAFCRLFNAQAIKALRVRDESVVRMAAEYDVDALLLDTYTAGQQGGTGQTFDWSLALRVKALGRPVILSGGLTPGNVRTAIETVQPYAVDVASGVERSPGRKDTDKLRRFIEACRNV